MKKTRIFSATLSMSALALAVLAGCSSLPADNPSLMQARADYQAAQNNPDTREFAAAELRLANEALARADSSWNNRDRPSEVDHYAYIAKQRIAAAQQTGQQRAAERSTAAAAAERDKILLAARTQEADAATRDANRAKAVAAASIREASAAQRDAAAAQARADATQTAANDAMARNAQLEAMLRDMNAKQTDRGMVITIGDVLFDTNRADLKAGGVNGIDKLAAFMQQYPERKVRIEGYTDSVGSDAANQELSARRADAVRVALINLGISADRISTRGYGESMPVASNDSAAGRQMNRRVEIVLSDTNGTLSAAAR